MRSTARISRAALRLAVVPFIGLDLTVAWWDRIRPTVAGLPFNLAWVIGWTALTPLCLWGAHRLDRRRVADPGGEGP